MKPCIESSFAHASVDVIGPAETLSENELDSQESQCVSALDDQCEKKPSPQQVQRWRRLAVAVCVVSIFVVFLVSVVWFIGAARSDSSAALAVAFDGFLSVVSSSAVVWRFYGEEKASERFKKERRASLIIGSCFVLSAIFVFIYSSRSLINDEESQAAQMTFILAGVSTAVYFLLFLAKFSLAKKLRSIALKADSFDAFTGGLTALSVIIVALAEEAAWFVDAAFALLIASATFMYGFKLLLSIVGQQDFGENVCILEGWYKCCHE